MPHTSRRLKHLIWEVLTYACLSFVSISFASGNPPRKQQSLMILQAQAACKGPDDPVVRWNAATAIVHAACHQRHMKQGMQQTWLQVSLGTFTGVRASWLIPMPKPSTPFWLAPQASRSSVWRTASVCAPPSASPVTPCTPAT